VLQLLSRHKGIVVVGVLLAMPLLLLYAQTKSPGARGPIVGLVIDASSLVERALLWSAGGILDGLEHYVTSVGSYHELAELRRMRTSAGALATRVDELERENDELRALARAAEAIDGPRPIGARVVARNGDPIANLYTIDLGTADGVRRGDGVIDKDGVVGLVRDTGRMSSNVLLLSDSSSAIDVIVQRTRARGILRGQGSGDGYVASVNDFDKLRDVRTGDKVVTSGLGARFPSGLLVGTVTDVEAGDDSLYLRARIRPAARFDTVEHVAILVHRQAPRAPPLGHEDGGVDVEEHVEAVEPTPSVPAAAPAGVPPAPQTPTTSPPSNAPVPSPPASPAPSPTAAQAPP
jgi:rod shape-determining protein MreC